MEAIQPLMSPTKLLNIMRSWFSALLTSRKTAPKRQQKTAQMWLRLTNRRGNFYITYWVKPLPASSKVCCVKNCLSSSLSLFSIITILF